MNVNWSNELQVLDRVEPSRDLWADALARTASPRPAARRGVRGLTWIDPRRRPAAALGIGLGIAGLAAALVVALGVFSAGPAYAVTTNPDGSVTITLSQFSALPALNQELTQDGLPLKAVPATPDCPFGAGSYTGPRGSGLAPTNSIRMNTSQIASEGAVGVIAVSQAATSGNLLLVEATTLPPAPSCINSAIFGTP
jgi:hypothetical protein